MPSRPPNAAASALMVQGDARLTGGSVADLKSAVGAYEDAVRADPESAAPRAKLGEALYRSSKLADDPKTARALLADAEEVLADGLAIDFDDAAIRAAMETVSTARWLVTTETTAEGHALLRAADASFAAGRYAEALRDYERVAESDPMHFGAVKWVGRCHDALGNAVEAEAWLKRAISMQPLDAQAYLFLESALSRQKKLKEMFTNAYRAVAAQPQHPWAWVQLADLLAQAKRPLSRLRLKPPGRIAKNTKKPGLVLTVDPGTAPALARVWEAYVDEASSGIRAKKTAFKQERDALAAMIDEARSVLAKGEALPPEIQTLVGLADPDTLTGVTYVLRFRDPMRIEFEAWKRSAPSASTQPAVMVELFISKTKLRPV